MLSLSTTVVAVDAIQPDVALRTVVAQAIATLVAMAVERLLLLQQVVAVVLANRL